jgi:hypothetical protein
MGVISLGIFRHFFLVKDGTARKIILILAGCISLWSISRGVAIALYVHETITREQIQDYVSMSHYIVYLPVLIAAIYLAISKK